MALSEKEVRDVALLARLELSDEEVAKLTPQLASIMAFVEQLQALDTTGVEPLTQAIETKNRWSSDQLRPGLDREAALANAPKRDAECFLVPPVLG